MTSATRRRTLALGASGAAVLLLLTAPSPFACLQTLRDGGTAGEPTGPLIALLSLLAWLLAAWLLLSVAATAGSHLPGALGRVLRPVSQRLAPAAVRRAVEVGLGLTVAVGVLGATPAAAASGPAEPPSAPAGISLDWPTEPAPPLEGGAPAPSAEADVEPPEAAPAPAPAAAVEPVVVHPGDSLWALAEQHLAARGQSTTDAAVARAWPTWWAANRDAVGDDPDLIQPGTRLTPPPAAGRAPVGPASS